MVNPICLAALRLITNSNFFGCSTGRSAGLPPLRILSTFLADTEVGVAPCKGGMDEFETRSCPEDSDGLLQRICYSSTGFAFSQRFAELDGCTLIDVGTGSKRNDLHRRTSDTIDDS